MRNQESMEGDQPVQIHSHVLQPLQPQTYVQEYCPLETGLPTSVFQAVSETLLLLSKVLNYLCRFIWKEPMQYYVSGKVEFNACQVSLLRHNSFFVSLWTFQPTLVAHDNRTRNAEQTLRIYLIDLLLKIKFLVPDFDPESKAESRRWKHPISSPPRKCQDTNYHGHWNASGIMSVDVLERGCTYNSDNYWISFGGTPSHYHPEEMRQVCSKTIHLLTRAEWPGTKHPTIMGSGCCFFFFFFFFFFYFTIFYQGSPYNKSWFPMGPWVKNRIHT